MPDNQGLPYATELFDEISAEADNFTQLNALQPSGDTYQSLQNDLINNPSLVGRWRLMKWVFAVASRRVLVTARELLFKLRWGTQAWYKKLALDFQYGELLVFQDGIWVYPTVNESAKIIKYCSVSEDANGKVNLKVGKDDGAGNFIPLTTPELNAFKKYMALKKVAGVGIKFISTNPDIARFAFTVYVDPMRYYVDTDNPTNPLNGSLLTDSTTYPVEAATKQYIKDLKFNGLYQLNDHVDVINNLAGVTNCVCTQADVKYGFFNYQSIFTKPGLQYRPFAGAMQISTTTGETLRDLIIYQPSNESEE